MRLQASYFRKTFYFQFATKTSRGAMAERTCWFITIREATESSCIGIGEAAPLIGLSADFYPDYEERLAHVINLFNACHIHSSHVRSGATIDRVYRLLTKHVPVLKTYSSMLFAFETAVLDWAQGGQRILFQNAFVQGNGIPINGLIWMDDKEAMLRQVEIKIKKDFFPCIKLKIGGLDFDQECELLRQIRLRFGNNIVIRLDANGAFHPSEVETKLNTLSPFFIHSIEQPIKPRLEQMEDVCRQSPIPVALDEELIGITSEKEKRQLLARLAPRYIILKPTLHGGLYGCMRWIAIAQQLNIGWWMTSALESNLGLNVIAQFVSEWNDLPTQGLGTGTIYKNNSVSPLYIEQGKLYYDSEKHWSEVMNQR